MGMSTSNSEVQAREEGRRLYHTISAALNRSLEEILDTTEGDPHLVYGTLAAVLLERAVRGAVGAMIEPEKVVVQVQKIFGRVCTTAAASKLLEETDSLKRGRGFLLQSVIDPKAG